MQSPQENMPWKNSTSGETVKLWQKYSDRPSERFSLLFRITVIKTVTHWRVGVVFLRCTIGRAMEHLL